MELNKYSNIVDMLHYEKRSGFTLGFLNESDPFYPDHVKESFEIKIKYCDGKEKEKTIATIEGVLFRMTEYKEENGEFVDPFEYDNADEACVGRHIWLNYGVYPPVPENFPNVVYIKNIRLSKPYRGGDVEGALLFAIKQIISRDCHTAVDHVAYIIGKNENRSMFDSCEHISVETDEDGNVIALV